MLIAGRTLFIIMKKTTYSGYGVTLTEAKAYLRVENSDEDLLIDSLVTASYLQAIAETNQDFLQTSYTQSFVSSSGTLFLTSQDITHLSTGSLVSADGVSYTFIADQYTGDVSYITAESGSLPANVKVAMLMLVSNWFENRQPDVIGASVSPLSFSVQALLSPYKITKAT